jgi:hypothetical protein
VKKSGNARFHGQNKLLSWHMAAPHLGNFNQVATYRNSSNNTRKFNPQSVFNKNSPHAHMKLEFDVLGVARKLVKYVAHVSKKKIEKKCSKRK